MGIMARSHKTQNSPRLRDECLNLTRFVSRDDAVDQMARWRFDYNVTRQHSSLGNLTPSEYARRRQEYSASEAAIFSVQTVHKMGQGHTPVGTSAGCQVSGERQHRVHFNQFRLPGSARSGMIPYLPNSRLAGQLQPLGRQSTAPLVAVLLATHNGARYLPEQLSSILNQESCYVHVWVSDDHSTDGTLQWLQEQATIDDRIYLLPTSRPFGSAALNFYRLITDVDLSHYDSIALADQDDIWTPTKLAHGSATLRAFEADGYSSNVIAFWPDGRRRILHKSQPQRRLDFMFESAGPGCSYQISALCALQLQRFLIEHSKDVETIENHDWLIYAWARSHSKRWHIDNTPTLLYRQHSQNAIGANAGISAFNRRLRWVQTGWYRNQVLQLAKLLRDTPGFSRECAEAITMIRSSGWRTRITLLIKLPQLRRRLADRLLLGLAFTSGIFWLSNRRAPAPSRG